MDKNRRRPGVLALFAVLSVMACAGLVSCSRDSGPPVRVLLITLDTTRADHMGFMGGDVRTPNLDSIAADSAVFDNCFSTANSTLPSHASILSSLYVKDHKLIENAYRLPDLDRFLPRVFKGRGVPTAAFTSTGLFSPQTNFGQGFDTYQYPQTKETTANDVTDRALAWLGENGDKGFFMWVHYFDPHMYYTPPRQFSEMYARRSADTYTNPYPSRFSNYYHTKNNEMRDAWARSGYLAYSNDPQFYRNLYSGEISYMDSELGRLVEGLKDSGAYDDCIIVVVADHGESLGEKGIFFDHAFIYDKNVQVPLVIKPAGRGNPGHRDEPVSTVDIYPTVLELCGIPVPGGIRGKSLAGVVEGTNTSGYGREDVYYEHILENFIGVKSGDYTYIANVLNEGKDGVLRRNPGSEELYSAGDISQSKEISADNPEAVERFRVLVDGFYADNPMGLSPVKIEDASHTEKLKALGYVQ